MKFFQKEQIGKVRTKIVATVGPASSDEGVLREMAEAGVDVFRLNFSHGTHDEHSAQLEKIRKIGADTGRQIAILQDLCGPKIRLGSIPGDVVACDFGAEFLLAVDPGSGDDPHYLTCSHPALTEELEVGHSVLFADGTVAMEVASRRPGKAWLRVTLPGLIRSNQGISVPGGASTVAALTEKDLGDLEWTAKHQVEYVGLSFVRRAEDVIALRRELEARGSTARIVAKIEKRQALANLDGIIAETDAVMVARGDLGVELDPTKVPAVQKRIIAACHNARVPVITATQMLNSMENSSRPTRAEASDVFNAVLDGSDAVMLSGETAIGQYPVMAVSIMSQIAREAEDLMFAHARGGAAWGGQMWKPAHSDYAIAGTSPANLGVARAGQVRPITESVVEAASVVSRRLNAALLMVTTYSGRTALVLSKHRNPAPILALAPDPEVARAMALFWGVTPLPIPEGMTNRDELREFVLDWCHKHELIKAGDNVVVVRGGLPDNPTHSEVVVREIE